MIIRFLTIWFFLIVAGQASAQSISVAARVDKEKILIGEHFNLIIAATMPADRSAGTLNIDTFPHFEILQARVDTQQSGNDKIYQHTITLTSWDSGRWNIPSLSLPGSNRTKPITIDVSFSSPFDPQQEYHDVKDIMEVPKPGRETWFWYLIGLLLLILFFLLLFPPGRKKKAEGFVPDETIYRKSLKRLDQLSRNADGEPKQFHTELIAVFRDYLHKRKGIQSHSQTTEDLSRQLQVLNLEKDIQEPLTETLQLSDMVKFAKLRTSEAENKTSVENIKQAIIAIENKR